MRELSLRTGESESAPVRKMGGFAFCCGTIGRRVDGARDSAASVETVGVHCWCGMRGSFLKGWRSDSKYSTQQ